MSCIIKLEAYKLLVGFAILAFLSMSEKFGAFFKMLFVISLIFWLFSITTSGYRKYKFKNKGIYVFFIINLIFLALWSILHSVFYSDIVIQKYSYNYHPYPLFVILNIYAWLSFLFAIYLSSRVLCSEKEGKLADFRKSYWYFIGFIFLPIGIWFIQPKARLLVEQEKDIDD